MLITIAIPTYNNENTIANAIQGALFQDYNEDYEVLIVNNASKDNTQSVIASFTDKKIRVIVNKETCDMYSNHNICLKEAKGDYVLFCHSDDKLLPNALSLIAERIKERRYPKRYIIWGHSIFRDFFLSINGAGQQVNTMFSGEAAVKSFLDGGLTPSGTCYSRLSLIQLGGFPQSSSIAPEMDWVILIVAAFNLFEFEMIDRIFFVRKDASTARFDLSCHDRIAAREEAYKVLFMLINEEQKNFFIQQMLNKASTQRLRTLKKYIPYGKYIKLYIKRKMFASFAC